MPEYSEHRDWISQHLSKYFKDSEMKVFHEMPTFGLHLDVYFIEPKEYEFNLLLTSGMSTIPMTVDEHAENPSQLEFAELMLLLPKNIEFSDFTAEGTKNNWILAMLKQNARFPHEYKTWIQAGHTLQADADCLPYDSETDYVGCAVLYSVSFEEDFTIIDSNERRINIYSIFPLYKNELEHKIEHGFSGLLDLLSNSQPKEVFDFKRDNMLS